MGADGAGREGDVATPSPVYYRPMILWANIHFLVIRLFKCREYQIDQTLSFFSLSPMDFESKFHRTNRRAQVRSLYAPDESVLPAEVARISQAD
jgi:hypothetical protein